MTVWLGAVSCLLLLVLAVKKRMRLYRQLPETLESKASPVSLAIQESITVAGGIYMSLLLLGSFLQLTLPERLVVADMSFDPLATAAFLLSVLQPFCLTSKR